MKNIRVSLIIWSGLFLIVVMHPLSLFGAESEGSDGRGMYDMIMSYLNFSIVLAVAVKFGTPPIKQFLKSQSEEIAAGIKMVEEERERICVKIAETLELGKDSDTRFQDIKDRIVSDGERRKQEIIDDAKEEGQQIIEEAKRKVNFLIIRSKMKLKRELVEMATEMAIERLPSLITKKDNERLTHAFLSSVET